MNADEDLAHDTIVDEDEIFVDKGNESLKYK